MKSPPPSDAPGVLPLRREATRRKGRGAEDRAPPIFIELYDLVLLLYQVVRHFPKSQKFILGQRIETTAVDVLAAVIEGNLVRDKGPHLHRASVELDKLRVFVRLARDQEGRARNTLSRLAADDPKRARYEQELAQAQLDQDLYFVFRAITPHHAPLSETELAGKLERHKGDYKALVDTIRIACANAESELALLLAPHLRRPREAKKALANVFAAPGAVRVNATSVTVTLEPAGTPNERQAFGALFEQVNRLGLTLPGDPDARRLRFQLQL